MNVGHTERSVILLLGQSSCFWFSPNRSCGDCLLLLEMDEITRGV